MMGTRFEKWLVMGEVGVSSRTMVAAMAGIVPEMAKSPHKGMTYDVPHDPDDLRRCVEMAEYCEVTKEDLEKVTRVFKWWKPFIDAWDELVAMFKEEVPGRYGSAPKTYARIQELDEGSRFLDGLVKTGGKG